MGNQPREPIYFTLLKFTYKLQKISYLLFSVLLSFDLMECVCKTSKLCLDINAARRIKQRIRHKFI